MKIRIATRKELKKHLRNDPVRPHIKADWRTSYGREVFVLDNNGDIDAVLCVAYTDEVPKCEKDMSTPGLDVAVFYTVWSYNKGAGREIIMQALDLVKSQKPMVERYVTLSPLTQTATRFHQRNGAINIGIHKDCQNFEYF
jgi:hypothetical protein|tara:strand:+ start:4761 stop:5183 length:423 start_codon:yes stop_codon:yes gene_type:complete